MLLEILWRHVDWGAAWLITHLLIELDVRLIFVFVVINQRITREVKNL